MNLSILRRNDGDFLSRYIYPLIGFILIYSVFELFQKDDSILISDLLYLQGELNGEILEVSHGGDIEHNYYSLHLKGIKKPFRFRNCAYQGLKHDLRKVMHLSIGYIEEGDQYFDSIILTDLDRNVELLKLDSINECRSNTKSIFRYFFILLIIISFSRVIYYKIKP